MISGRNASLHSYVLLARRDTRGTADTGLTTTEQAHFGATNVSLLSQHPSMTDGMSGPDQRTPAAGANLGSSPAAHETYGMQGTLMLAALFGSLPAQFA